MDDFLSLACDAARAAGAIARAGFRTSMSVREKSDKEFVSEYDLKAEEDLVSRIRQKFPDHGIYSEEAGDIKHDSRYLWVLDPIDGTHNYIYGLPYYGVSVGLLEDGRPLVGAICLPEEDELLHAVRGKGAFLNGEKVNVSKRPLDRAYVFYQCPYPHSGRMPYEVFERITHNIQVVRILGAAVTNIRHLAAGCADAYIMHSLRPYDVAAGTLIIEEAGGRVTDFAGRPWNMESRSYLASNGLIHDKLLEELK